AHDERESQALPDLGIVERLGEPLERRASPTDEELVLVDRVQRDDDQRHPEQRDDDDRGDPGDGMPAERHAGVASQPFAPRPRPTTRSRMSSASRLIAIAEPNG